MFVIEHRHGLFALGEGSSDSFKKTSAGIENLPFGVGRILAVFANGEDPVDGKLRSAQGKSSLDRRINLEAMFPGQVPAHVSLGKLVDVHRHELHVRPDPAVIVEALENLADDHVRVRVEPILGDDGGNFFLGHGANDFLLVSNP